MSAGFDPYAGVHSWDEMTSLERLRYVHERDEGDLARVEVEKLAEHLAMLEDEREAALKWLHDNFFGEDDDPEEWREKPVSEWLNLLYGWGNQAWFTAGKEAERADKANSQLHAVVTERDALRAAENSQAKPDA